MSARGAKLPLEVFQDLQEVTQAWQPTQVSRSMTSPRLFSVEAGRAVTAGRQRVQALRRFRPAIAGFAVAAWSEGRPGIVRILGRMGAV